MDLLAENNQLNIHDQSWKIYSLNPTMPPHYIGMNAEVKDSLIPEGCTILGKVENSVLFPGVFVGQDTMIRDSVIMSNSAIGRNCYITKAIVGSNTEIMDENIIGDGSEIAVVADGSRIGGGKKSESGEDVC